MSEILPTLDPREEDLKIVTLMVGKERPAVIDVEDILNVFSRTYLASNKADRDIRMLKYAATDWIVPKVLTWLSESGTEGINVIYKGVSYYTRNDY